MTPLWKKILIYLWPLAIPLGIILLRLVLVEDISSLLDFSAWKRATKDCIYLYIYQEPLSSRLWYAFPMISFVLVMLLLSFFCWFKKPCIASLFGTMLAGWGLCGFPGLLLIYSSVMTMSRWSSSAWILLILPSIYLLLPLTLALQSNKPKEKYTRKDLLKDTQEKKKPPRGINWSDINW